MPQCAVVGCNSTHRKTKGGTIRYHRFPGDAKTRSKWIQACGKELNNCSTARICSRHFTDESYERDVQHELLGLPTRCRLKKGALPERNLPTDFLKEEIVLETAIDILLAVGLVPKSGKMFGGLPEDLNKMHIMEDVREGCSVQPSSPGHAEQRTNKEVKAESNAENGYKSDSLHTEIDLYNGVKEECKDEKSESAPEAQESEKSHGSNHLNDETNSNSSGENQGSKRKSDGEESPVKRLRSDIQENFNAREKIFNDYMEMVDCSSIDKIESHSEQILSQIRTLNELAKEKEREWNTIIHQKKIKEELLLRLQRKKQIMRLNDSSDMLDETEDRFSSSQSLLKPELRNPNSMERFKFRTILPKSQNGQDLGLVDFRQGKRQVVDVQSLIADYRQRHPEAVPRRGRRIRTLQGDSRNSIVNLALGSGAEIKHNSSNDELGMLVNSGRLGTDLSGKDSGPFKDMLLQLAQLSQTERNEFFQNVANKPPPPYPEVTVHPVPTSTSTPHTNSLLHGILTKSPQKQNSKTSFSPTLARLLTAPERANSNHLTSTPTISGNSLLHGNNMSISEILSSNKARNEITITPVGSYETSTKSKNDDEEGEDNADRLVIDESSEAMDGRRGDNSSDAGDEVPQCQGCNLKPAQFVCAGCGNQWYCSRDCQVAAWDEHSEICSG
ncbi:uncharacterized protein LOC109606944 isoform X2 [Aethina tumida]|uniref:uncharacterized protein LOC109606944 isoform X2 n=1 Tax=Aethina tumida TaxID=116153 RepID=UPI002147428F|nr:uncharacterized protein LOC109606944 isoform X2 [Aethina tumida]XP_049818886.1 uncharacterized protein LOC109606944 isoform X2 [Aethina tumida]